MAKKKILYVQTSGTDTPERLYSPLILAQTALAMDIEPVVYFLGQGLKVLIKGEAEKIKLGNFPSVLDVIKDSKEKGITIMACEQSMQLFGGEVGAGSLIPEAEIAGAATLNDLALDADAILSF